MNCIKSLCIVFLLALMTVSCGGGGSSSSGGTDAGLEDATLSYNGITTEATISADNAEEINQDVMLAYDSISLTSDILSRSSQGSIAELKLDYKSMFLLLSGSKKIINTTSRASYNVSDSISGSCGGTAYISGSLDDTRGYFSLQGDFNNYCSEGIAYDGSIAMTGNFSGNTISIDTLESGSMSYDELTVTTTDRSVKATGTITFQVLSDYTQATANLTMYEGSTNKYVMFKNFVEKDYKNTGVVTYDSQPYDYTSQMSVSGAVYISSYGYVTVSTDELLCYDSNGDTVGGLIRAVGRNNSAVKIEHAPGNSFNYNGDYDGDGVFDESEENTPPTISGNPSTTVTAGNTYSFAPTVSDADNDTLNFSITNKPDWASFDITTGVLTGTPNIESIGAYTGIVITVTDGTESVLLPQFDIIVTRPFVILKTGQTISYAKNDDGDYQAGLTRNYTRDNVNEIVTDNTTGLIWQDGISVAESTFYWDDAVAHCASLYLAGRHDWRVPTIKELTTIINYGNNNPAIADAFQNVAAYYHWSSTTSKSMEWHSSLHHYGINFDTGFDIYDFNDDGYKFNVRCVSGDLLGDTILTRDNSNEIVSDNTNNIMWQDTIEAGSITKNWSNAISYCENLNLGGYSDWRLPTINELRSIVDYETYNLSIYSIFQNFALSYASYWSSTSEVNNNHLFAWYMHFYNGVASYYVKTDNYHVRCVRGGQN